MYDVILFSDTVGRGWLSKPLAPYRLATELRNHGYTVKVVDFFSYWLEDPESLEQLLLKLISHKTLFLGFSGVFYGRKSTGDSISSYQQYRASKFNLSTWPADTEYTNAILAGIKEKWPDIKFVYGGVYKEGRDAVLLETMDYIVRGFGDKKIIEVADHLSKQTALRRNILNRKLIDHDVNGLEFRFPESEVIYTNDDDIVFGEVLPLETSRGCMFKCDFCDFPLLGRKKSDPEYLKKSHILVRELERNFQQFGTDKYMIVDDTFNETTEKIEALLRVRDQAKIDIKFSSYLRVDLLSRFPEQIAMLKDLGIQSAFLGIESLNWESARAIGKGIHPNKVKDTLYKMKDAWGDQTSLHGSFIVGLPHDSPETLEQWVPWVLDQSPLDGFDFNPLGINKFDNTSTLAVNSEKLGYSFPDGISTDERPDNWVNQYWSRHDAVQYSNEILSYAWNSGRLRVSGWDLMGLQNTGFDFSQLKSTPIRDINYQHCAEFIQQAWKDYREKLLA